MRTTRRLYACEFPCGTVKVGVTATQGTQRFSSTRLEGKQPARIYLGPPHECVGYETERELLQRVRNLGGIALKPHREFFSGISFLLACKLVEQVTSRDGAPSALPAGFTAGGLFLRSRVDHDTHFFPCA
jgi:hypothetical protein